MEKSLYRKKFSVTKDAFYFDNNSGISVAIFEFSNENNNNLYCVKLRIGFNDKKEFVEPGFYIERQNPIGKFWESGKYRLFWLSSDIESRSVEMEIIEKP